MSREKFFFIAFACSTCWYFFPGYIFQALSFFNWIVWCVSSLTPSAYVADGVLARIAPHVRLRRILIPPSDPYVQNVHVSAITGSTGSGSGLGLNPLPTFDINQFLRYELGSYRGVSY